MIFPSSLRTRSRFPLVVGGVAPLPVGPFRGLVGGGAVYLYLGSDTLGGITCATPGLIW